MSKRMGACAWKHSPDLADSASHPKAERRTREGSVWLNPRQEDLAPFAFWTHFAEIPDDRNPDLMDERILLRFQLLRPADTDNLPLPIDIVNTQFQTMVQSR